jgi:hypothetical protein
MSSYWHVETHLPFMSNLWVCSRNAKIGLLR